MRLPTEPVLRSHHRISLPALLLGVLLLFAFDGARAAGNSSTPHGQPDEMFRFPPSSQLDFSDTLEAPAGQHGFLTVADDGHFHWADGTRARFWGINVSSTRLAIPPQQIEQVVTNFARAGLNLVRLEAIDNRNCLLGSVERPDSLHFDRNYLDHLDHWMDSLRRHGIYYYLDLLDFRTFKDRDGVPNAGSLDRGARPYAIFDPYLIRLQEDYAGRLLRHRNPYSHLRPIDDPALAMVEICNENGFFLYPEKLETLVEPYNSDLRARWNRWLRDRYLTREDLASAWSQGNGASALLPDEDPDRNTVEFPLLAYGQPPAGAAGADRITARRAPARLRDGVEFLTEMQRDYFRQMHDYLRSIGLRVPVTAVVSNDVIPDVASVSWECDFTAENWYGDSQNTDARYPGVNFYSNHDPLRDDSTGGFAPYTAALRWNGKPVVVREWGVPWPNRWRAASEPEVLAYASLQDYDAVLLFGYQTNRALNGAEADALNDLAYQCDPTVWGLHALAGQAFLNGAIRPAKHMLTLVYPPMRQFTWPNRIGDLTRAAWCVRLNSAPGAPDGALSLAPGATEEEDQRSLHDLLDRLGKTGAPVNADMLASGVWRSDTGEITFRSHEGLLSVQTPTLRMLAGELTPGRVYDLGGGLRFSTPTPFGALMVLALDGRPVESSRHLVVKMVSRAENTGQVLEKAPSGAVSDWALRVPGAAPILTFGHASSQPTKLWFAPRPVSAHLALTRLAHTTGKTQSKPQKTATVPARSLLALYMVDGTWEMTIRNGRASLACDTAGVNGIALGNRFTTTGNVLELAETATGDKSKAVPAP
ncbi:MAG TPA: hypothetical protein VFA07_18200 [Chthonomonadaceae bacterium]|nr:hypothetical protein [Chthonomonadaceae bacterium]